MEMISKILDIGYLAKLWYILIHILKDYCVPLVVFQIVLVEYPYIYYVTSLAYVISKAYIDYVEFFVDDKDLEA